MNFVLTLGSQQYFKVVVFVFVLFLPIIKNLTESHKAQVVPHMGKQKVQTIDLDQF